MDVQVLKVIVEVSIFFRNPQGGADPDGPDVPERLRIVWLDLGSCLGCPFILWRSTRAQRARGLELRRIALLGGESHYH